MKTFNIFYRGYVRVKANDIDAAAYRYILERSLVCRRWGGFDVSEDAYRGFCEV